MYGDSGLPEVRKQNKRKVKLVMSEANQTPSPVAAPTHHKGGFPLKVTEAGVLFELQEFDKESNNAGFVFYTKEFLTKEALEANLDAETILMCVNRHFNFAMRQKANNSVPKDEDARAKQLHEGKIMLLSVEDAKAYKPGERDLTSPAGVGKKLAELREEFYAARDSGDTERAAALREQSKLLVAKMQEMLCKDLGIAPGV